jgi:hypothetical protein
MLRSLHGEQASYSAVEHLATIYFSREWRNGRFAVFTVAFDVSGSKNQPVVCVAGFISSADNWLKFETEWNERLAEDGIQCMHMQEYVSSSGEFKGWDTQKKRTRGQALVMDLVSIIRDNTFRKFGSMIFTSLMQHIDPINRLQFSVEKCIALVGGHAASDVAKWARMERLEILPKLVFEDGDYGKGDLIERLKGDGWPMPSFEPKRDDISSTGFVTKGFVPLQAADMLAHTYADVGRDYHSSPDGTFDDSKWRFNQFEEMHGQIAPYSEESLKQMNESMNILRAQEEWAKAKDLPWH